MSATTAAATRDRRREGAAGRRRDAARRASRCCASCRCPPTSTSTATSSAAGSCRRWTSPAAMLASRRARGRVATVAVNSFMFKQPVLIGDVVSFFAQVVRVGRTSITVDVEVYAQRNPHDVRHRQGDRGDPHLRRRRRGPPAARPAVAMTRRTMRAQCGARATCAARARDAPVRLGNEGACSGRRGIVETPGCASAHPRGRHAATARRVKPTRRERP